MPRWLDRLLPRLTIEAPEEPEESTQTDMIDEIYLPRAAKRTKDPRRRRCKPGKERGDAFGIGRVLREYFSEVLLFVLNHRQVHEEKHRRE